MTEVSSMRAVHGIDIGGSKIELVGYAIEPDGALVERHRRRVATPREDFAAFQQAIAELVNEADATLGLQAPVGLGLPGIVDAASGRQLSSNVPALNGRPVAQSLRERLQRPVVVGNDCQCFALSEAQGGAADGLPSMFGAILGTGAAGGYCVDGRLIRGLNGIAGEWGHWSLPASLLARHGVPLIDCPCGLRGCLERYVSGTGLSNLHRHFGGEGSEAVAIAARAAAGDALARQVLDIHVDLLAQAFATLVMTIDPHAIVLGGGLSKLGHLYEQLPAAMARHLFQGLAMPAILPPHFGDAGGARGAALLALQSHP
ncbi:ROK family protein [Pelomonas sp. SE-A7]|uniref:ROK family protein n=1 Tax=Pelomonas sp. SE-A7 TaxID=3054953 RepID=UPI00259CD43D|nr:ROK family protein [Pelomonas sp. SE-A7]MDM4767667.1 ROK family protein [Pelomonas sp. SE-A7]